MSKPVGNKKSFAIVAVIMLTLVIATIVIASFGSIRGATNIFFVSVIILSIIILVFAFNLARKNPTKKKVKRRILSTLLSIGLILVIVFNGAVYNFNVVVGTFLSKADVNQEDIADAEIASKDISEKITDDGFVLLENKENALPLDTDNDKEKNINVFGIGSVNTVYGGSGSGAGDESNNVTLQQGLENAGFSINSELASFYEDNKAKKKEQDNFNLVGADYTLSEPTLSNDLLARAEDFSNVAIITITRAGGEGGDLPTDMSEYGGSTENHYLELSKDEKELIDQITSMDFKKVIVVINSSNAMELGFLEDEGIDAAVWVGGPGSTGMNSLGKILDGTINPSGRLTDTYVYDVTSSPAYYNAGDFRYTDEQGNIKESSPSFVNYQEGIYVGYRYYETRYVNNETGEVDEEAYQNAVQYPFGYGLSYTTFTQEITDYITTDEKITMTVNVTNTGNVEGKEVVQLYYTAPYYEGGIEKSHVVLGAFDKTDILKPGESQTVTLELAVEDMASYDYQNEKAYVLDTGTYQIKLMKNAHDVIDYRTYDVPDTIIYNGENKRASDGLAATNQFGEAEGDLTYVSRADWEGTLPTERTENEKATEELLKALNDRSVEDNSDNEDIKFADHGLELKDVVGLDYNDPKWDQLLEQLSINDMAFLIGNSLYSTQELLSIDKPATKDIDGPAGLNGLLTGLNGVQFPSSVVIASTWNTDLSQELGETFANEATANGVSGIYAPAVNIHRTPFSGRNFEYYSEDGLLSGKIAAAFIKGTNSKGVYAYIKHFALNDQETNRQGLAVWANEQAIREIYLKAFEIPVKEGEATAVMSSYNRIGTTWSGAHYGLLTTVLRNEWGFEGMVVTDMNLNEYQDVDQGIRAGNDLMLAPFGKEPTKLSTETNTGRQAMRRASHNILYTIANSNAFEIKIQYPYWLLFIGLGNIIVLGLITLGFYKLMYTKSKRETIDIH